MIDIKNVEVEQKKVEILLSPTEHSLVMELVFVGLALAKNRGMGSADYKNYESVVNKLNREGPNSE